MRRGKKKRCRNRGARPKPQWGLHAKASVVCDALGNPLAFRLTPGQRHEITQAEALRAVLGDRGYDSNTFIERAEGLGAEAVIPSKKNRTELRQIDRELYKDHNKVERFIGRVKHYRRVATRYDKSVLSYTSFLHVACIMTWLL